MAQGRKKNAVTDGEALFPEADRLRYGDNRRKEPLFLRKQLGNAAQKYGLLTEAQKQAHQVLIRWADLETSGKLREMNESTLQGEFVADVFGGVLGYARFSENLDHWEVSQHYPLPQGQSADAVIGCFSKDQPGRPQAIIEFKGPRTNVDRDRSAGRTPVQQCWDYLSHVPECPWGIVCNYVSIRLYHRDETPGCYEVFTLQELREEPRFREFLAVFDRCGLLADVLGQAPLALRLLRGKKERQKVVGKELYKQYHDNRLDLVAHLCREPHNKDLNTAIAVAQTLLDRIIFIAFCEDRSLLPARCIERTWREIGAFAVAQNPRWHNFLNLFRSVDQGNPQFAISPFNGGLFRHNADVDGLDLDDRWTTFFRTIGGYDFQGEVNVDVLGHLFEQSITDLEALRADPGLLDQRGKAAGRRKHEGIYYTPRPITEYIVRNTLGPCIRDRFAAIAQEHRLAPDAEPDKKTRKAWVACRQEMLRSLGGLRVCDPACGSGAFLIQAYEYLEGVYSDLIRGLAEHGGADETALLADARQTILNENLFGVDLSPEAVEIAQLALWIRTAQRGKTLADLSHNIQCGNSIVDDPEADPKAFLWEACFPAVFAEGGFDCIVGNPPYVKLQNFRQRHEKVAAYLVDRYRSARTGNFDMYLPFIERGLELLKPAGRLGFIAPSVWVYNEYGQGLRELVLEGKTLERFIDFKSHQVFEDATNYTALQFFRRGGCEAIDAADASDGAPDTHETYRVSYAGLSSGAWAFSSEDVTGIMEKMSAVSRPLSEASGGIIVGIQTSADAVYHLTRLGPGKYFSRSLQKEVDLEDEIMKPLISGEDAVPFAVPPTDRYLLFPYHVTRSECRLFSPKEMETQFRRTWAYLGENETFLRERERGKMDHDRWYAYNYPKNLDKQERAKLGLPQTVSHLSAFCDPDGERYFNNVRVNGILEREDRAFSLWFLLGVLNSRAMDFFFRQTAKPKDRGYFEANKQFIAPLPVPDVKPAQQRSVAGIARGLADLHAKRLLAFAKVRRRIVVDLLPPSLRQTPPALVPTPRVLDRFVEVPIPETLAALGKFAKRRLDMAQREEWDAYLTRERNAIAVINGKIEDLTAELNARVYALYGLEEADVRIIESSTADRR